MSKPAGAQVGLLRVEAHQPEETLCRVVPLPGVAQLDPQPVVLLAQGEVLPRREVLQAVRLVAAHRPAMGGRRAGCRGGGG